MVFTLGQRVDIDGAAKVLLAGGLVAFPTETVYGLGADATQPAAIVRVFAVKGRPLDNPLIVHLADAERLSDVAVATPLATSLAQRYWPGPLTLVLEARPHMAAATAGLSTVAVRVPDHPVARALIRAAGVPVAAPSANRSGRPSPTTAADVAAELGDEVDLVLDGGPCIVGLESTVVDARGDTPVVLREGAITREDLGAAATGPREEHRSPGTRHRHYQPSCPLTIAPPGEGAATASQLAAERPGLRVGAVTTERPSSSVIPVAQFTTAEELGQLLYRSFREAETLGVDLLVIEGVIESGFGRAVMDRLRRAAQR